MPPCPQSTYFRLLSRSELNTTLAVDKYKKINDAILRQQFYSQAEKILTDYKERNQPLGNLANYLQAIKMSNEFLDEKRESFFGYISLSRLALPYIKTRMSGQEFILSGKLGQALNIAKANNKTDEKGHQPNFEVNSQAEKEFILLLINYLNFYIIERKANKIQFDANSINTILKLNNIEKVINIEISELYSYIQHYEEKRPQPLREREDDLRSPAPSLKVQEPLPVRPPSPEEDEFDYAQRCVFNIINDYLAKQYCFNWYGKRRAKELKKDVIESKNVEKFNAIINNFILTGKTKSDYSCLSFFRSISRKSGNNPHSLRMMFERHRLI